MPTDVERVRRTWAAAAGAGDVAASIFYGRLFRERPELRGLFSDDMAAQGRKLVQTLGFVVDSLDAPDRLLPAAQSLARRHVDYGVAPEHYAHVGDALIWTLEETLGPEFSPADRAAWESVYAGLADAMIKAAYPDHGAEAVAQ